MKRFIILTIVAIIIAGASVIFLFQDGRNPYSPTPTPDLSNGSSDGQIIPTPELSVSKVFVVYSDAGYDPAIVTIKKGDIVVFKNESSKMMWTASAVHPTHNAYPGSGIELCGTQTLVPNFDACKGYGFGESWEFQFEEQGTWKYHNHLQPNHTGTIITE